MRKENKTLLKRILAAMLSVTLMSGVAVMTPIADIVGTNITAHAIEDIIAQGDYWRITYDDEDDNCKLTFFGTIPNSGAIEAEAEDIYFASGADTASLDELIQASWYFATGYVTEVTTEDGAKTSADASYLFSDFYNVTSMDLSNLDTSNATDMEGMFYYCENLKTIIVGNGWKTNSVTDSDYMFAGCTALVGGQGTTYDSTKTDKTYARIDGSANAPGYLTASGYTVTWLDEDGTELCTETVAEGETPPTPTKKDDTGKKYQYVGYKETADGNMKNGLPPAVTDNATYIAVFAEVKALQLGAIYNMGECIEFPLSGAYFYQSDGNVNSNYSGITYLTYNSYNSNATQYNFNLTQYDTQDTYTLGLHIKCPVNYGSDVSIRVKSGDGTQNNPYQFEVVKNLLDVAEAHLSAPQYLMPGMTYYLPASSGKRFSIAENSNGTTRRTPFITDSNNPFSSDNTNRISFNYSSDFTVTVDSNKIVCTDADGRQQTLTADGDYNKWLIKSVSYGDYFTLLVEPVNNYEEVFTVSIPQFNDEHKFMRVQYGLDGDFVGLPNYTDGWFDDIDENTTISYYNGDDNNKYAVGSDVTISKSLTLTPFISTATMNGTVKNYTKTRLNIRESNAGTLESGAVVDLEARAGTYILSDVELNFNGKNYMFDKITFTDSKNNTTSYEYYPKENLNFDELVITEVGQTFTLTLGEGMTATGHGTTVDGVYTDDTYGTVTIKSDKPMFTRFALTREEVIAGIPPYQLEEMSDDEIEAAVAMALENNENNGSMYTSPVSYKGVENGQLVYDIMLYRPTVAKISHVITTNSEFANAKTGDILFPSESIDLTENGQYDVSASFDKSYVKTTDEFEGLVDNTVDTHNLASGGGITNALTMGKDGVINGNYATYEGLEMNETEATFTPALGTDPETGNTIFGNAWVITGLIISDLEIAFEKYEMPVIGQTKQKVFSLESAKVDFRNISECEIIVISNETDTPEIIVSYNGTVVSPENYSVSSSDVENGVGTVTISGKGLYIGSVEKKFAVLTKAMTSDISARKKVGKNTKVTLTGTWNIPKDAQNIKGGIARLSTDDIDVTKYNVYIKGVYKTSAITSPNAKYSYSLTMNSANSAKNLFAVTYVTYEIDSKQFVSISDVSQSLISFPS